jgi:hypothetical protein
MLSTSDIGIIEIKKKMNKKANISLLLFLISDKELKNFERYEIIDTKRVTNAKLNTKLCKYSVKLNKNSRFIKNT